MRVLLIILAFFIARPATGQDGGYFLLNQTAATGPALATSSDPDVTKWIQATLLSTQSIADHLTTAVTSLKSSGVWAQCDFIYPMDGDGINKPYVEQMRYNLKDTATLKLTPSMTLPGATATGLNTGTGGWMYQDVYATTFIEQNSNHLALYSRTQSTVEKYDAGYTGPSETFAMALRWSTSNDSYFSCFGGFGSGFTNTDSRGFYVISRTSSASMEYYKNGSLGVTRTNASSPPTDGYIAIGGKGTLTLAQVEGSAPTGREYAWASGGRGLTETQVSNYATIVNTYQTARSRNTY